MKGENLQNRPFITLDANIIIGYLPKGKSPVEKGDVEELLKYHKYNICSIFLTTRIYFDVSEDPWKEDIKYTCKKFKISYLPAVGRLDFSKFDEDVYGSNQDVQCLNSLKRTIFPKASSSGKKEQNRLADLDHLLAHKKAKNDFFVTGEKAILNQAKALRKMGIEVKSLEEILKLLK